MSLYTFPFLYLNPLEAFHFFVLWSPTPKRNQFVAVPRRPVSHYPDSVFLVCTLKHPFQPFCPGTLRQSPRRWACQTPPPSFLPPLSTRVTVYSILEYRRFLCFMLRFVFFGCASFPNRWYPSAWQPRLSLAQAFPFHLELSYRFT